MMKAGILSSCSWILLPWVVKWVMFSESIGLPSMTSTVRGWFREAVGTEWRLANSLSINAYPVAPVSTRADVRMETFLVVTVHEISKCFPSSELSSKATPAFDRVDNERDLSKKMRDQDEDHEET